MRRRGTASLARHCVCSLGWAGEHVTVKIESSHGRQFASGTASVAATTSTDEGQTARRRNPYYKTAFCSDYMGPQVRVMACVKVDLMVWCVLS